MGVSLAHKNRNLGGVGLADTKRSGNPLRHAHTYIGMRTESNIIYFEAEDDAPDIGQDKGRGKGGTEQSKERDRLGAELYSRIATGDRNALAGLIELYRASLILFIYGIVKDEYDAEELTIDAFAQLIKNRSRFQGESSFKTYLFAIGRNLALRHLKKRRIHYSLDEVGETPGEGTPEAEYLLDEGKQRLYAIMRELKAEHREVLHLVYFEGMSYSDSARVLKKGKRQIEGLLYRAKKSLKTRLETEGLIYEDF